MEEGELTLQEVATLCLVIHELPVDVQVEAMQTLANRTNLKLDKITAQYSGAVRKLHAAVKTHIDPRDMFSVIKGGKS